MGWTTLHRERGQSNDDFFKAELVGPDREIVASTTIKSVYYAAVREPDGEVWAMVALLHWAPRSHHNFGYKDQTEHVGPGVYRAPLKVLDALTETDNEYALEWRAKCREHHATKAAEKPLAVGTTIRVAEGLSFRSGRKAIKVDEFVYVGTPRRRDLFRTVGQGDFLVRLPQWRQLKIVDETP